MMSFNATLVMLTLVMAAKGAPQNMQIRGGQDNPDCTREREMRGEALWSNRVIKGDVDKKTALAQLSINDYVTIFDATYQFLSNFYDTKSPPCLVQFNICADAATYEDSCLPLWLIEDGLQEDEMASDLFGQFRSYFYDNYDVTSCAIEYMSCTDNY